MKDFTVILLIGTLVTVTLQGCTSRTVHIPLQMKQSRGQYIRSPSKDARSSHLLHYPQDGDTAIFEKNFVINGQLLCILLLYDT